ncbi:MAG: galactokinase [Verrucomicrobiota bacterium]
MADSATRAFETRFGRPPEIIAEAPGRVNLIGEHVDYNKGFVMPMAIDRRTMICLSPSPDSDYHIASSTNGCEPTRFSAPTKNESDSFWSNYVKGVIAGFESREIRIPPFQAWFEADLPVGGGLSSSAALEVATATALEAFTGQQLLLEEKARLCQKAEHDFAGVPCGIMDQFTVTHACEGTLLLLDCRVCEADVIPFHNSDIAVVIANTNVQHSLADGEYGKRREQCEEAALALGVPSLRDASWLELENARGRLDDETFRRARHVISEIERTTFCANRLKAQEWTAVASLLYASHDSLRDDYEVSCEELDTMVDITRSPEFDGLVYGSRMTGAGFGGSTVSLVDRSILDRFIDTLSERYHQQTGIEPSVFATQPSGGTRVVKGEPKD